MSGLKLSNFGWRSQYGCRNDSKEDDLDDSDQLCSHSTVLTLVELVNPPSITSTWPNNWRGNNVLSLNATPNKRCRSTQRYLFAWKGRYREEQMHTERLAKEILKALKPDDEEASSIPLKTPISPSTDTLWTQIQGLMAQSFWAHSSRQGSSLTSWHTGITPMT